MSGGDLDGDVYMVIWDENIVNSVKDIYPPAPVEKPDDLISKQVVDPKDNFANIKYYMGNDYLGELSNIHTVLCDHAGKDGPKDVHNMKLASLISIMVDFAKHGQCMNADEIKDARERCKHLYPDFMAKEERGQDEIYFSPNILGQLYRKVGYESYYEECTKSEYEWSIKYEYNMQPFLRSIFSDFGKDSAGIGLKPHGNYLIEVYQKIVNPMI